MRCINVILMVALCSLAGQPQAATANGVQRGDVLPAATLQGLNGPTADLSGFRGTPLIINVWASWCGPCRAEMASLERLAWLDESSYFTVIGISVDDHPGQARAALNAANATLSHYIDARLHLEKLLGASRLPLTVLVDGDGRVIEKVYGARAWDSRSARERIASAFNQPLPLR